MSVLSDEAPVASVYRIRVGQTERVWRKGDKLVDGPAYPVDEACTNDVDELVVEKL